MLYLQESGRDKLEKEAQDDVGQFDLADPEICQFELVNHELSNAWYILKNGSLVKLSLVNPNPRYWQCIGWGFH